MTYKGTVAYPEGTLCSIKGCSNPVDIRGFCHSHYERFRLGREIGAPMRPRKYENLQQAFDFYTVKTEHGLIWIGATARGYGRLGGGTGGKTLQAHRVAWELVNGPIPEGLELDHDIGCPKNCVTVEHLTPRTKSEHAKMGWKRGQFEGNGWTEESRQKRLRVKFCLVCGDEFTGDSKAKYCSPKCKNKAGNDRRKK